MSIAQRRAYLLRPVREPIRKNADGEYLPIKWLPKWLVEVRFPSTVHAVLKFAPQDMP